MNGVVLPGSSGLLAESSLAPLTTGVTVFIGRFGSGKTEAAINYALALVQASRPDGRDSTWTGRLARLESCAWDSVILVDLDIVTPYFRSREAAEALRELGVVVIAPAEVGQHLDVPAIAPEILGAIEQPGRPVVLDIGGDRQGARALGQFSAAIRRQGLRRSVRVHFVVNPYRPFTDTIEAVRGSIAEIEASARLQVTSLVSNPNLMGDTTIEVILEGHARVKAFAQVLEVPIAFVCIEHRWIACYGGDGSFEGELSELGSPVLALDRHFAMSWE
jgi:hypothetical protein